MGDARRRGDYATRKAAPRGVFARGGPIPAVELAPALMQVRGDNGLIGNKQRQTGSRYTAVDGRARYVFDGSALRCVLD